MDRGFKCVTDAIDPKRVAETVKKVANAFNGPNHGMQARRPKQKRPEHVWKQLKAKIEAHIPIKDGSMPHPSAENPDDHSTIYVQDSAGQNGLHWAYNHRFEQTTGESFLETEQMNTECLTLSSTLGGFRQLAVGGGSQASLSN